MATNLESHALPCGLQITAELLHARRLQGSRVVSPLPRAVLGEVALVPRGAHGVPAVRSVRFSARRHVEDLGGRQGTAKGKPCPGLGRACARSHVDSNAQVVARKADVLDAVIVEVVERAELQQADVLKGNLKHG